jgi:hypothetical protein
MTEKRDLRAVTVLLLVAAVAGCSSVSGLMPPGTLPKCPGRLISTDEIAGDFVYRDQVRITSPAVDVGFDLVTQKRGRKLVLVGFNSFGAKTFAVTQEGTDTEVEVFPGPPLQVAPINVLRDLHRVRFFPDAGPPATDGHIETSSHGVRVAEVWRDGRLVTKRFGTGDDAVTVRYGRGDAVAEPADIDALAAVVRGEGLRTRAYVKNARCGYEMTIVNVERDDVMRYARPGGLLNADSPPAP